MRNYPKYYLPGLTGLYLLLMALIVHPSCERDDDLVAITFFDTFDPVVSSGGIETGGLMRANREISISEFGVCYSTNANPTIEDDVSPGTNLQGSWDQAQYKVEFTSLLPPLLASETTYYIRAFVTTKTGTAYGNQKVITTN
jgi:hypothetical protein